MGTPKSAINRINAEMKRAVANAEFVKQLDAIGLLAGEQLAAEFHDMIKAELDALDQVIRAGRNHCGGGAMIRNGVSREW